MHSTTWVPKPSRRLQPAWDWRVSFAMDNTHARNQDNENWSGKQSLDHRCDAPEWHHLSGAVPLSLLILESAVMCRCCRMEMTWWDWCQKYLPQLSARWWKARWAVRCGLGINSTKAKLMPFTTKKIIPEFHLLQLNEQKLTLSSNVKHFHVILDPKLNWN